MTLSPGDFDALRAVVRATSGMVLEDGKEYLVQARLRAMVRQEGAGSVQALLARLRAEPADGALRDRFVQAVLIGETQFFRDGHPYETLRTTVLPELIAGASARRRLYVWSAAAATGQEAYSLAMLLADFPELGSWDVRILATDLSDAMRARCERGTYSEAEVARGLPEAMRARWFRASPSGTWTARDALRKRVRVRKLNLVEPWPGIARMDLILIRNVLIYFDAATKEDILRRAVEHLRPGGYLMLGTSETLPAPIPGLTQVKIGRSILYRRT